MADDVSKERASGKHACAQRTMAQVEFFMESMQPLLGTWRGEGKGSFPTIASFEYGEELVFSRAHPKKVRQWLEAKGPVFRGTPSQMHCVCRHRQCFPTRTRLGAWKIRRLCTPRAATSA